MRDIQLGKLIDRHQQRDAIHIAVAPMIAGEALQPGQHVGLVDGSTDTVGIQNKPAIGIVDPFLTVKIYKGERFWMFLYPDTIASLRHEWTHPAFDSPASVSRVEIESIAAELDMTYNQLMRAAEMWLNDEEYTVEQGSEHWRATFPSFVGTFWKHYEIVTGITVKDHDASFFSCSC